MRVKVIHEMKALNSGNACVWMSAGSSMKEVRKIKKENETKLLHCVRGTYVHYRIYPEPGFKLLTALTRPTTSGHPIASTIDVNPSSGAYRCGESFFSQHYTSTSNGECSHCMFVFAQCRTPTPSGFHHCCMSYRVT